MGLLRIQPYHTAVKELERIEYLLEEHMKDIKGLGTDYYIYADRLRGKNRSSWIFKNSPMSWARSSEEHKERVKQHLPYPLGPEK